MSAPKRKSDFDAEEAVSKRVRKEISPEHLNYQINVETLHIQDLRIQPRSDGAEDIPLWHTDAEEMEVVENGPHPDNDQNEDMDMEVEVARDGPDRGDAEAEGMGPWGERVGEMEGVAGVGDEGAVVGQGEAAERAADVPNVENEEVESDGNVAELEALISDVSYEESEDESVGDSENPDAVPEISQELEGDSDAQTEESREAERDSDAETEESREEEGDSENSDAEDEDEEIEGQGESADIEDDLRNAEAEDSDDEDDSSYTDGRGDESDGDNDPPVEETDQALREEGERERKVGDWTSLVPPSYSTRGQVMTPEEVQKLLKLVLKTESRFRQHAPPPGLLEWVEPNNDEFAIPENGRTAVGLEKALVAYRSGQWVTERPGYIQVYNAVDREWPYGKRHCWVLNFFRKGYSYGAAKVAKLAYDVIRIDPDIGFSESIRLQHSGIPAPLRDEPAEAPEPDPVSSAGGRGCGPFLDHTVPEATRATGMDGPL
ncbi:hypothetical protein F5Y17DRAFT_463283 [Xylariaceae sp. FL0594]|nr:hypothetical protein F5Y17DRAFT_463283 [Xylariaceae sp. FL0594]